MRKLLMLCCALLGLAACNSYQEIPVTLPDGFVVKAKVADTPAKQERGLMFVTNLPEDEGMIFIFDRDEDQAFWMKNTLIDLDMVFIDSTRTITSVANEVPRSQLDTPEDEVAIAFGYGKYVLELAGGVAQKHKVIPGARLQFEDHAK